MKCALTITSWQLVTAVKGEWKPIDLDKVKTLVWREKRDFSSRKFQGSLETILSAHLLPWLTLTMALYSLQAKEVNVRNTFLKRDLCDINNDFNLLWTSGMRKAEQHFLRNWTMHWVQPESFCLEWQQVLLCSMHCVTSFMLLLPAFELFCEQHSL